MKTMGVMVAGLALAAGALMAQPKVKNKKEADAVMAIMNSQDPDEQIKAVEELLLKFADTEFKGVALQVATMAAQQKNDFEKMALYAERTLQADPKNYNVMLMMATGIAQKTREFDLDKEEKLKSAERYANDALELVKTAAKPRPDITDEQWIGAKKDYTATGYEALGMVAIARKKPADAVTHFKTAVDSAATPDVTTKVRLAMAYNMMGNFEAALPLIDSVLADQNLNPTVRQFAAQEKLKAATGKAAQKK